MGEDERECNVLLPWVGVRLTLSASPHSMASCSPSSFPVPPSNRNEPCIPRGKTTQLPCAALCDVVPFNSTVTKGLANRAAHRLNIGCSYNAWQTLIKTLLVSWSFGLWDGMLFYFELFSRPCKTITCIFIAYLLTTCFLFCIIIELEKYAVFRSAS